LAGIDASVYVLDCLPNMSDEMARERLEPFIRQLRAARPDTPIVLVGHIIGGLAGERNVFLREVCDRLKLPERFWLFAGTLEPRKNLGGLLDAYLQEIDAGKRLPVLALAGTRGWSDERLNRLIARGESIGQVRRLGYVSVKDLATLYSGCILLWMPSLYEGFGLPLLEAQQCGAAVVHGDHASMCEAADGLGVVTGTDVGALRRTIDQIVRGEAPLTCRIALMPPDDARTASEVIWGCFHRAFST
jgi:glycosyltransferase involved in cell wall biosynthesis